MKIHSRYRVAKNILLFWCLFIGIGAVAGAWGMLAAPDGSALGMREMLPFFQVLPFADLLFQNFIFSGIALLCVNGLTNLTAAALIIAGKKCGVTLGRVFGVTLMLWICIQFIIFPLNFMSTIYFIFGLAQAATGYAARVFCTQEEYHFDAGEYRNVGKNNRELVVYFSRMGYTRRIAYECADASGAEIFELHTPEPTAGTRGFWWCGRFGMHHWPMNVELPQRELSTYDRVTICTPIWVFSVSAPVRGFCEAAAGQIKNSDYVLVHYQNLFYQHAADEMDTLLGIRHDNLRSICCRTGKFTTIEE